MILQVFSAKNDLHDFQDFQQAISRDKIQLESFYLVVKL